MKSFPQQPFPKQPLPKQPQENGEPVFREPWEAQAFSLVIALHQQGVFSWDEWATTLSATIAEAQRAGDPDTGENYYQHWLAALERLSIEKGLSVAAEMQDRKEAWKQAYLATPHGQPIELCKK